MRIIQAATSFKRYAPELVRPILYCAAAIVGVKMARLDFDARQWMAILYPLLTAASFMVTVVMALYYVYVRTIRVVFATVFYFSAETTVLALLTLTTGTHPALIVDQARPLIVWARMFMLLSILWIIHDGARLIFKDFESVIDHNAS